MPAALKNVTTSDAYSAAATLEYMGAIGASVVVANNAAAVEFDESEDARGVWGSEIFWPPFIGWYPIRSSGIRFRSAVPGKPAQVSCQLLNEDEASGVGALSPFTSTISAAGDVTQAGTTMIGRINDDGSIESGAGFDSAHAGAGDYVITFGTPYANVPGIVATAISANARIVVVRNSSKTSVEFLTFNNAGTLVDTHFIFMVNPIG